MKTDITLDRKQGKILGIYLNSTTATQVLAYVKYRIKNASKFSIVTPNPEIILASTTDQKLTTALNQADLALPDGIGLAFAAGFLNLGPLNILPGRKVFLHLISEANKNSWGVFLLGGKGRVSVKAAEVLGRKYGKVKFASAEGPKINRNGEPDTQVDTLIQKTCLQKINKFRPHLLFIAMGPTKQEKWMMKNLPRLNVGGAMTVGGTFNYVTGASKVPPKWMEDFGLEWGWRLFTEPWRLGRIINAVIIFPWKVFVSKLNRG